MLLSECHFVAPFLPRLLISLTTEISRADDYGGTVANRKARPLAGLSLNVPLRRDPVLGRDAVCGTGCSPLKQPRAPGELFNRFACLYTAHNGGAHEAANGNIGTPAISRIQDRAEEAVRQPILSPRAGGSRVHPRKRCVTTFGSPPQGGLFGDLLGYRFFSRPCTFCVTAPRPLWCYLIPAGWPLDRNRSGDHCNPHS